MTELDFYWQKWKPFSDTGAVLECIYKKIGGRNTRRSSVIIYEVTNPEYPDKEKIGKFFVIGPRRERSLIELINDGPLFDSVKEAKPHAEKLLHDHITLIMMGKINWWTGKEKVVE